MKKVNMKTYLLLFVILVALFPLRAFAQSEMEDVIYVKNGSIYRGTIVEQVPNVSYKIEVAHDSVIYIAEGDVQKIAREPVAATEGHTYRHADELEDVIYLKNGIIYRGIMLEEVLGVSYKIGIAKDWGIMVVKAAEIEKITKEKKTYILDKRGERAQLLGYHRPDPKIGYKDRGGFFQAQIDVQDAGGGVRFIGGYKFNQFAIIGAGFGLGGIAYGANRANSINVILNPYSGLYAPFFLYYSGDILKKDVIPFYEIEAGYAAAGSLADGDGAFYGTVHFLKGGPMANAGFGVRFYAGAKFVLSFSLNLEIQYARTEVYSEQGGMAPPIDIYRSMTMLLPTFKIGLGRMYRE